MASNGDHSGIVRTVWKLRDKNAPSQPLAQLLYALSQTAICTYAAGYGYIFYLISQYRFINLLKENF